MKLVSLLFSLLALLMPAVLWGAAKPIPNPPELNATSYFLVDFDSGRVLAEQNPDDPVEPASITKLMTAYLVDKAIADGDIALEEMVTISVHLRLNITRLCLEGATRPLDKPSGVKKMDC